MVVGFRSSFVEFSDDIRIQLVNDAVSIPLVRRLHWSWSLRFSTTRNSSSLMIQRLSLNPHLRLRRKEKAISILIVDDTDAIVHLLTHFLGELSDDIEIARDGDEAITLISNAAASDAPYDVVLMDLQMPNKSGLQAAREIRQRGINVPLIAMTAGRFAEQDCIAAGFDGFVTKPFDRNHLVKYVGEFVR